MAKWVTYQRRNGHHGFVYANVYTGASEHLGELRADTPDETIVRWVVDTEKLRSGDLLLLASGRDLMFLDTDAEA